MLSVDEVEGMIIIECINDLKKSSILDYFNREKSICSKKCDV